MSPQQLPLAVQLPDDEIFSTFLAGDNSTLLSWLESLPTTEPPLRRSQQLTWLSGASGVGKSHLMHSVIASAGSQYRIAYLPLRELAKADASAVLQGIDQADLICLDDIDTVTLEQNWSFELFSLINRVTDNESTRLVMTAKQSAAQTKVLLPDLQSRFQWATGFQVQPLNDEEKINALILRAQWRGLELPNDVAAFMTQRLGRSMRDLMKALNELDKASITYQRRLTIPFVKQVLEI
ncbi:DnaA regulatory inactivator Hda [Idiomarina loihiensis]|jgi:DnaA family protein|uniref:ATPase involved in DNA replication initiation n=1 Tax=Idiomarina loihiensis (strain ATCC BAA-735 / DSM 15497 / L2-TR) TaxID=283942 RepID=Q5QXP8_IDILO|nr:MULTISPECIES: DnaA regulatory inactivator Hda [Idiomarina]AAV82308.1 ATPase involved in DNA replication initiation [Idiomarina loihiensis L2TR]AGM36338.1 DNA replication initiation ATPase [Idiomarina loihiensis GSL 199]MAA61538.1 DnaA regulatory inactivator Hda [Idiomarina sp.]MBL4855781.1 DnaA regulatory inactivator Hda [Idiomarina sp.]MRJ44106.1 DnaA regulatory inactivator Hda [Idiomarina loihiensis]|tara:strand:+ start:1724 stop:2437 length:714 start_codon:yes stop_codon:yes gene_type:complete